MIPAMNKWLVKLGLKRRARRRARRSRSATRRRRGAGCLEHLSAALIVAVWVIYGFYVEGLPAKEARTLIIFMPPLSEVWSHFISVLTDGYRTSLYWSIFGRACIACWSLCAVLSGGGADWLCDGLVANVERPVSSGGGIYAADSAAALIPLAIIYLGIGDKSKIALLFLAALWVMVLSARSGVQGIHLSKIHAAYTLGASKKQVLWRVILPNALPEIFTGMRVAMGVCWGTLVAAELVGASSGIGFMITVAGKFLATSLVFLGNHHHWRHRLCH